MRYRNKRLLDAARDSDCVLCSANDGTTVPAHLPGSFYRMPAGTAQKTHDWLVAHLCSRCHDMMDTHWRKDSTMRMMALCLTLERLFERGVIAVE